MLKFLIILIILILQILTYLIIRGGTMNKTPQEIDDEEKAQNKWLEDENKKKQARKKKRGEWLKCILKRKEKSKEKIKKN